MRYSLVNYDPITGKLLQTKGDSGGLLMIAKITDEGLSVSYDVFPSVGCTVRVGSVYARSYSTYDYWTTTPVTEILDEGSDYMKFRTRNTYYILRSL